MWPNGCGFKSPGMDHFIKSIATSPNIVPKFSGGQCQTCVKLRGENTQNYKIGNRIFFRNFQVDNNKRHFIKNRLF
jgi:hypothetical protein